MKLLIALILLISCKTQEQIRREQLVDSLANQMRQGQNVSADMTIEMAEVKKQILQLHGMIEESGQQNQTSQETRISDLFSRVQVLEEKSSTLVASLDKQTTAIEAMKTQITEQGKYLDTLLKTLKNINKKKPKKKVAKKSPYEIAMGTYRSAKYGKARNLLATLEGKKAYKGKARARILHNLAMCEFMLKNDENALVYFSKLYSEQPSSAYNANGLLFMAKSFRRLKRNDEAKATLQELMTKFPKSKKVGEAKSLLKQL